MAAALPLCAGSSGPLPDPFPALLTLRTASAPFRLVFEVQHNPNRRGAGPLEKRQGGYSVEHYSDPFEAFVQGNSFVAFNTPFAYRTPEGRLFTGNKIYAFYAPSNLHGTLTPDVDVNLAHGPLESEGGADANPLFDFEKLRGNTTRRLVSQVHLWLQATLRLGMPDLYTVQWISGDRGVLVVSTGELKNFTFSIRANALDRTEVTGPGNIKEG